MFEVYIKQSLIMIALFSGIPLLVSSIAGLLVSVIQAATQIQEQSVSHLVRFVAVGAVIALFGPWFFSEISEFIQQTLASIGMMRAI